ncbi:GNAT family N-acetyltransferase [bacterium]|nr:GNAT family N-acetyltransferase [bacterium]
MPLQIRPLNWRRHSEDVLEFQREIYETNFPGFIATAQFLRDYSNELRRAMNNPTEGLYVLEEEGRACGFLWVSLIGTMVDPCIGYIRNIYVAPSLRGQGHGRELLVFAENWCTSRGVLRIALDASCCNKHAVQLYERTGYAAVRLRMEKRLGVSEEHKEPGDQ